MRVLVTLNNRIIKQIPKVAISEVRVAGAAISLERGAATVVVIRWKGGTEGQNEFKFDFHEPAGELTAKAFLTALKTDRSVAAEAFAD